MMHALRAVPWFCAFIAAYGLALPSATRAETLAEALALAYQTNPVLLSQRAQLKAVDEELIQAQAPLGPTATFQTVPSISQNKYGPNPSNLANTGQVQISITQPLYNGGKTAYAIRVARNKIHAAQQILRITEGTIMQSVIQAYADVLRDTESLAIRTQDIDTLADILKESRARFKVGEITRTDVAETEAQYAAARALLASAKGQYNISSAAYAAVVGHEPHALVPVETLQNLPLHLSSALETAEVRAPELLQAHYIAAQSDNKARLAKAGYHPTLALTGSAGLSGPLSPYATDTLLRTMTGGLTFSLPLVDNGLLASQIRQALEQYNSDRLSIETAHRSVVQNITNAWSQMQAAKETMALQADNMKATQAAYQGMRIEQRVGQRSVFDVLNAKQILVNAALSYAAARHDILVAQASLLRAMGQCEAPQLVPGLAQYNGEAYEHFIAHKGQYPWTPIIRAVDKIGTSKPLRP